MDIAELPPAERATFALGLKERYEAELEATGHEAGQAVIDAINAYIAEALLAMALGTQAVEAAEEVMK